MMGMGLRTALAVVFLTLVTRESSAFRLMGCTQDDDCDLTCARRWLDGSVSYAVNPNFPDTGLSGSAEEQTDLLRCAAEAWHAQSRADFQFIYGGTTNKSGLNANDGANTLSWVDAHGGDALAVTLLTLGTANGSASSFDIVFFATIGPDENPRTVQWSGPGEPGGGQFDIWGIAVHEFGHGLGLHHSQSTEATMYRSAISGGLPLRTLELDDQQGLECLYGTRTAEAPLVEILSVSPAMGPILGGTEVVLEGANFSYASGSQVFIGGSALEPQFWQVETCSTIRIHAMPPHPAGSVSIKLNSDIGSVRLEDAYAYAGPQPEIFSVTPSEGFNAGGAVVEVHGQNFVDGAVVTIDGKALFDQNVVDVTTITGIVPESLVQGLVDVRLEQGEDEWVLPDGFTYTESPRFTRGDANGDQEHDLSDAIHQLAALFQGGPEGPCRDAADANDDGVLDISDPIRLLNYLFQDSEPLRAPFPEPGLDPTPDLLGCGG